MIVRRIFLLAVVLLGGWLAYSHLKTDYSRPWWDGTATQRICKVPYYDNSECTQARVTSDGEGIDGVTSRNGVYIDNFEFEGCYKAGDKTTGRFCTIYEGDQRWDIIPLFDNLD